MARVPHGLVRWGCRLWAVIMHAVPVGCCQQAETATLLVTGDPTLCVWRARAASLAQVRVCRPLVCLLYQPAAARPLQLREF